MSSDATRLSAGPPAASCRGLVFVLTSLVLFSAGCYRVKPAEPVTRYQSLPLKSLPEYLRGTIIERSDLVDVEPLVVSGFGLVVNLQDTGDNTQVPTPVREFMIREMVKRGIGSKLVPGFENTSPEDVLRDPRTAIVRADALVPPGARPGDTVDVRVTALPTSITSSLARGELYRTELKVGGANPMAPGVPIPIVVMGQGAVFVNPVHAMRNDPSNPAARRSLRTGWVLDGGSVMQSRPLVLRLRQPERRMARAIEQRIDARFASLKESQRDKVAQASDEGIVRVTIPPAFRGDWEHFAGVMSHLFFDASPQFVAVRARQLADAAVTPEAPLLNISYAWEGLGPAALPFVTPLMTHERPEVAFAAARAAAFLGDPAAPAALATMGATRGHPFQVNAIRVLGTLSPSPSVASLLRGLLDGDQSIARIEAYRSLLKQRDASIFSRVIDERFVLDVVPSAGPPLVFATRSGIPRIALIGSRPSLRMPFNFTGFDDRLTLASDQALRGINVFYRFPEGDGRAPVRMLSRSDLAELIARIGGDRAARQGDPSSASPGAGRLAMAYGDIVALLQAIADRQDIVAPGGDGAPSLVAATFVLESPPALTDAVLDAPPIPDQSRPAGTGAPIAALEPAPDTAPPPPAPAALAPGTDRPATDRPAIEPLPVSPAPTALPDPVLPVEPPPAGTGAPGDPIPTLDPPAGRPN